MAVMAVFITCSGNVVRGGGHDGYGCARCRGELLRRHGVPGASREAHLRDPANVVSQSVKATNVVGSADAGKHASPRGSREPDVPRVRPVVVFVCCSESSPS